MIDDWIEDEPTEVTRTRRDLHAKADELQAFVAECMAEFESEPPATK